MLWKKWSKKYAATRRSNARKFASDQLRNGIPMLRQSSKPEPSSPLPSAKHGSIRRERNGWPEYIVAVPPTAVVDELGFVRWPGIHRRRVLLLLEEKADA
jgi:hypothetical protein